MQYVSFFHNAGKHHLTKSFHARKNGTDVGVNAGEIRRIVTQSASMISSSRKASGSKQECSTDIKIIVMGDIGSLLSVCRQVKCV